MGSVDRRLFDEQRRCAIGHRDIVSNTMDLSGIGCPVSLTYASATR